MSYPQREPMPEAQQPWPPRAPKPGQNSSRLLPILGVALGLLGLIAGVGAWLRPAPVGNTDPAYSDQEVADATRAVCEAYAKGMRSIRAVASRTAEDEAAVLPVAVNSRLGEIAVSTYLLNTLSAYPATPANLQVLIRKLSQQYQEVALIQLADGAPPEWRSNKEVVDEVVPEIDQICR